MNAMPIHERKKFIAKKFNAKEFFEFTENKPENERYELIAGRIALMASPTSTHQRILLFLGRKLGDFLDGTTCEPFIAPLDVVLFKKDKSKAKNVFQPDVFVVCDPKKISEKRIYGAPDFVVEIISPSNSENDYYYKLPLYMKHGVREYWIIDPKTKSIIVHINGEDVKTYNFTFEDKVKVNIFEDFEIDFKELL
jgi:Uma2 family endonuclease